jgi:hypothetical protein
MGSRRCYTYGIIFVALFTGAFACVTQHGHAMRASAPVGYQFDSTIPRAVLDNYLSRSISMEGLLNGRGNFDDNIRMLDHIGAKFIGRSICLWGREGQLLDNFARAKV